MAEQRLDKIVAFVFGCTRSEAKELIKHKRVAVNGKTVTDCAFKLEPQTDKLSLDGAEAKYEEYVYYLMNKPKGVLSASRDSRAHTVIDLIRDKDRRPGLFCVGRLDKDTTGLLIITDDGKFGHRVISPKSHINKVYEVVLDGEVTDGMIDCFAKGVVLADGVCCRPAILEPGGKLKARITICEGKYHQIKRMFGTVGLGVVELKRISIGGLQLPEDLAMGEYTAIDADRLRERIDNK